MKVIVIDYGMGNLGSVRRAFEECGADVLITDSPEDLKLSTHIVLPGVGAFPDGMQNLSERGWIPAIEEAVHQDGIPFLGICLGMQLLTGIGYEGGVTRGLNLVPGEVVLFEQTSAKERIPHVGWNEVASVSPNDLFEKIPNGSDFYFVHSYYMKPEDSSSILATTPYCGQFASVVQRGNVYGVQFHPEKSQRTGFQLIKNFLNL